MTQTLLTVTLAVQPNSVALLEDRITQFRIDQETPGYADYAELKRAVPTLHFMALMVFRDSHYDPLFLLEVNFDGPEAEFWQALDAAAGAGLRDMLRSCALLPRHPLLPLLTAVCGGGPGLPALLEALSVRPTAAHRGNRGLTCARIHQDAALFETVQTALGDGAVFQAAQPSDIHRSLRDQLVTQYRWLDEPSQRRISRREVWTDLVLLVLFASVVLAALAVPGAVLALVLPAWSAAVLGVLALLLLQPQLPDLKDLLPNAWPANAGIVAASLVLAVPWVMLASVVLWALAGLAFVLEGGVGPGLGAWLGGALWKAVAGVAWAPALVLMLLRWVRRIEEADSTQFAPARKKDNLQKMSALEDQIGSVYQNHMGSIVLVKPGVLRSILLPLGHRALHLAIRATAQDGYLGDMRMIHFAHWALLNNGSRLVFLSNFDGPWDSYLDDFIEKANAGTTLAWTNCVGAPLARFLMLDGVKSGRQFKAWARHSMAPNLFWFSAYPKLTVNQIERNHAIAEGLRKRALTPGEARAWTTLL